MEEIENKETETRPQLLTILCILSFIGGGLSVFSNGFVFLFYEQFTSVENLEAFEQIFGADMNLDVLLNTSIYFYLFQSIFYGLSFFGVYKMWQMQKLGFHLYTLAQMVILILPEMFVPELPFPFVQLSITATFVFLYFTNLRFMNMSSTTS